MIPNGSINSFRVVTTKEIDSHSEKQLVKLFTFAGIVSINPHSHLLAIHMANFDYFFGELSRRYINSFAAMSVNFRSWQLIVVIIVIQIDLLNLGIMPFVKRLKFSKNVMIK